MKLCTKLVFKKLLFELRLHWLVLSFSELPDGFIVLLLGLKSIPQIKNKSQIQPPPLSGVLYPSRL